MYRLRTMDAQGSDYPCPSTNYRTFAEVRHDTQLRTEVS